MGKPARLVPLVERIDTTSQTKLLSFQRTSAAESEIVTGPNRMAFRVPALTGSRFNSNQKAWRGLHPEGKKAGRFCAETEVTRPVVVSLKLPGAKLIEMVPF